VLNNYSVPYTKPLPGADFNANVYSYDESHPQFDQDDYVNRVRNEAELLISLEGLKHALKYLWADLE